MIQYYTVKYKKPAIKFIQVNKMDGIRFFKAFHEISNDISNLKRYDIKHYHSKTQGVFYRLKIGAYRAIFEIRENELIILVIDIGSRGDIYKKNKL